jgi:hypothetical protein
MGRSSGNYPAELRERAVLMVREVRADYDSEWAAICGFRRNGAPSPEVLAHQLTLLVNSLRS